MAEPVPALTEQTVVGDISPTVRKKVRSKRRNRCLVPVACVTAFIILLNAGISLLLFEWRTPLTVSFDMTGTVNQFMAQVASQKLSDKDVTLTTARFNQALKAALTDYQQRHQAIILVAPAVVGGIPDITDDIQATVATDMTAQ